MARGLLLILHIGDGRSGTIVSYQHVRPLSGRVPAVIRVRFVLCFSMRPQAALMRHGRIQAALSMFCFLWSFSFSPAAGASEIRVGSGMIIGTPGRHIVKKKETLLDIARQYDLGFNEIADLYPGLDPWILPEGMALIIPSQWILPWATTKGMLINVAELRLYYCATAGPHPRVRTFPIGIGDREWLTPLGLFTVQEKRTRPTWYIPPSLRKKYGVTTMPPGPDNPLGDYWVGIGKSYGIHGTDIPWSVGRLVTHGCIRLYPEDIDALFKVIRIGTPVRIIYEPVKIGLVSGRVYVEVHRDIYGAIDDFTAYGNRRLNEKGLALRVDMEVFDRALDLRNGMPVDVTRGTE